MKQLLFIISIILTTMFVSCDKNEGFMGDHNTVNFEALSKDYEVVVIDSCEYVVYNSMRGYNGYGFMAHKGNCSFCEERNNKNKTITNEESN